MIDVLRGISILFVLMNHVHVRLFLDKYAYLDAMPGPLASALVWNGQRAVQIFFALSGYLIASTSITRWGSLDRIDVRAFYRLRFARIAPLLLALLSVLSFLHLAGLEDFLIARELGGLGRAWLAALTFHINVFEATHGYLPPSRDVLWSLSVEEAFYLAFPLVCVFTRSNRGVLLIIVAFVLAGPYARGVLAAGNEVWAEYSYLGGADAVCLGVATAIFAREHRLSRRASRWIGAAGTGLLLFGFAGGTTPVYRYLDDGGLVMSLMAVGTCLVILAGAGSEWNVPLSLRGLRWFGRRSYEIYLTHMFVVIALFRIFLLTGRSSRTVPMLFLGSFALSVLIGEVIGRWFTEPLNTYLRRGIDS